MKTLPELFNRATMTSVVPGKHFGDPVFTSRCYSWQFWSHLFDLCPGQAETILERIANKTTSWDRDWGGHHFRTHTRLTADGQVKSVQPRTLVAMPRGMTYDKKRYQVSDRTVLYFLEYGVVRDLLPSCGEKWCVAPEHQTGTNVHAVGV